jgi:hypothetical protein
MMFDVPVVERKKRRCVCTACGWRGYRVEPEKMACPSCGTGYVAETLPGNIPAICATCCHWVRNRKFPNRFGVCHRSTFNHHPLNGKETHELFGCINHEQKI